MQQELRTLLPQAARAAQLLEQWCKLPDHVAQLWLQLARAAGTRACAYLGCANLGGGGGPFTGEGEGSLRCSACSQVGSMAGRRAHGGCWRMRRVDEFGGACCGWMGSLYIACTAWCTFCLCGLAISLLPLQLVSLASAQSSLSSLASSSLSPPRCVQVLWHRLFAC